MRTLRRHHRARMRAKAVRVLRMRGLDQDGAAHLAPRLADNLRNCSCRLCTWRRGTPKRTEAAARLSELEQTLDPVGDLYDEAWLATELSCPCCGLAWRVAAVAMGAI